MLGTQNNFNLNTFSDNNKEGDIYYNGKRYKLEKHLFDDITNERAEGLTYHAYRKRIKRQKQKGQVINREIALKAETSKKLAFTYKNKPYKSLDSFFNKTSAEDKDPHLKNTAFAHRVKQLIENQNHDDIEEIIFIALNAKPYESLNLHIEHYKRNEMIRNGHATEEKINESINKEMTGR
ncbi:hypothetical protein [Vreelandella neptunia]|uniref:Uncharacterized protein n=1 Tax=Vreelandella neptunia TaxID=115551 RepID=A0ABS9S9U6_9GAMM|nr:hypothetical protein [Halomonas neptunia]MCH4812855.1 hypothetical protein [Halomonas neptunia]